MDLDPVFLSRLQFAFVISFHIIFPAFTIGLAAWLATIEGARMATGNVLYRRVFDFWLKGPRFEEDEEEVVQPPRYPCSLPSPVHRRKRF